MDDDDAGLHQPVPWARSRLQENQGTKRDPSHGCKALAVWHSHVPSRPRGPVVGSSVPHGTRPMSVVRAARAQCGICPRSTSCCNKPKFGLQCCNGRCSCPPAYHAPHAWHLDRSSHSPRALSVRFAAFHPPLRRPRLTLLGQMFRCSLLAPAPSTSPSWGFGWPSAKLGALGEAWGAGWLMSLVHGEPSVGLAFMGSLGATHAGRNAAIALGDTNQISAPLIWGHARPPPKEMGQLQRRRLLDREATRNNLLARLHDTHG